MVCFVAQSLSAKQNIFVRQTQDHYANSARQWIITCETRYQQFTTACSSCTLNPCPRALLSTSTSYSPELTKQTQRHPHHKPTADASNTLFEQQYNHGPRESPFRWPDQRGCEGSSASNSVQQSCNGPSGCSSSEDVDIRPDPQLEAKPCRR